MQIELHDLVSGDLAVFEPSGGRCGMISILVCSKLISYLFCGNHKIAIDFPASVCLFLPNGQILFRRSIALRERCFSLTPFVNDIAVLA